jgi:very-short-patch-repair endonuclease
MAAVLAAGPGAVLSRHSAAALWRIRETSRGRPDVSAPRRVQRPGVDARLIALPADEVTVHRGVPVTTAARTLFDLAGALTLQQLEAAVTEAEIGRLGSPTSLADLVARHPRAPGIANVRRVLRQNTVARTVTKSTLEIAFLAFLDAHGLPRPRTNAKIALGNGREPMVDAAWPEHRLVAELDSYGIHTTHRNFEEDRARDRALTVAGWRVVRITWRQLHDGDPGTLVAELSALLRRPRPQRSRIRATGR